MAGASIYGELKKMERKGGEKRGTPRRPVGAAAVTARRHSNPCTTAAPGKDRRREGAAAMPACRAVPWRAPLVWLVFPWRPDPTNGRSVRSSSSLPPATTISPGALDWTQYLLHGQRTAAPVIGRRDAQDSRRDPTRRRRACGYNTSISLYGSATEDSYRPHRRTPRGY
jgi:hypothetical protein